MPANAAIAGVGMAASAIGGALSASSAGPQLVKLPAPAALYPQLNQQMQTQLAGTGAQATGTLGQMTATGMPTDVGPAWQAMVAANQRMTAEGRANLLESFGAGGLRYSSPAMGAAVDYETQSNLNFMQILANYTMQAQENARQRQLAAAEFGESQFQAAATTTYPTAALVTGTPSVGGSLLSSGGQSLQTISLLRALGVPGF